MSFRQFFPIPVFIAVLATTLVLLDLQPNPLIPHLWSWISFQAWAMYFLAGCTLKGGAKVFLGYLGGALASIAIIELKGLIGQWAQLPGTPALAISVFLVVIAVISAERVPMFNFVPAWFIGAGVYFGVMTLAGKMTPEEKQNVTFASTTILLMVSCAVGLVYGVVTVLIRGKYEAWLKARSVQPVMADK